MTLTKLVELTWYLSQTLNSKVIAPTDNESILKTTEKSSLFWNTSDVGRVMEESIF